MKPKFNIGDYVEATTSFLAYGSTKDNKSYIPKKDIITRTQKIRGIIVGAVYRFKGKTYTPSYYSGEHPEWYAEKGVLFWQIKRGYLNKPVEALEKDIELLISINSQIVDMIENDRKDHNLIPWKHMDVSEGYCSWLSGEMKEMFKEHPELFQRDSKGRFIKTT